ncbi:MAG TPA: bacterial transcriptional activator domain-containing protein [Acidimicrobiales bacterium]|nr:bacterial transcriptional activator domain-containing protein [Acidimicrobiales bacterium]
MSRAHRRGRDLRGGLGALGKCLLLLFAVPVAIVRLWAERPLGPLRLSPGSLSSLTVWLHLVLIVLGLLWVAAAASLVRELAGAFGGGATSSSWSGRWAAAVAALVLASTASAVALAALPRPGTAPPAAVAPQARAAARATPLVVAPGECLADVAARALGSPALWPELAAANRELPQLPGRFVDPALLRDGWCLRAPAAADLAAAGAPPNATPAGTLAELSLLGIGTIGTAALVRRVRLLRRAAASLRRVGERPPRPSEEGAGVESLLAPFAEGTLLDWIECASRLLGSLAEAHAVPEDVLLVRAGPEAVDVVFATAAPAAAPFVGHEGGRIWSLALDEDLGHLRRLAAGGRRHLRALVPVGEAAGSAYLLGLGRGRRLSLEGGPEEVAAMLAGLVESLRVLPWAGELSVELVGLDPPPSAEQSYQLFASTPEGLRELAGRRGGASAGSSLVVVAPGGPAVDEALLAAVGAVAGVVACGGPASAVLRLTGGGRGELAPFGLDLAVPAPGAEQRRRFDLLLAEASRPPSLVATSYLGGAAPAGGLPERGAVEVRLLTGSPALVGAVGAPAERDAARVTELVAYLALHPEGVGRGAVTAALFGRATLHGAPARLDLLLAAARRCLGSGGDGRGRLELHDDEHLRLSTEVTLDAERFRAAAAHARALGPDAARDLLAAAFELLDPAALARWPAWDWLAADGHLEALRSDVVDAAHHLATLATAGGEHALAAGILRGARLIEPASEILARDLMVLEAERGDTPAAARAYAELEAALAALGGNEPSAESRALYLRLAR